jgi:subtilisin family serine protease
VDATGQRTAYSSFGPNSSKLKPDLVAVVPFPSAWRSRPFSGTSAAAPQAATLAGLIWSKHPDWTARRVRAELQNDAEQLTKSRPDPETGHGRIHLP